MSKQSINQNHNWLNRFLIIMIFLLLQLRPMQAVVRYSDLLARFVFLPEFPIFWNFQFINGRFWFPDDLIAILFVISLITIFLGIQENTILWIVVFTG